MVEREVPIELLLQGRELRLHLRQPDVTTAKKVADTLDDSLENVRIIAHDAATVGVLFDATPNSNQLMAYMASIEALRVAPDIRARVVINSHTGTLVVGHNVRISQVAVSHGGLSLQVLPRIQAKADPNDPKRFLEETVWVNPVTNLSTPVPPEGVIPAEVPGSLNLISGVSVEAIVNALNALGARPRDMVAIFEALHRAGALHAELVVL